MAPTNIIVPGAPFIGKRKRGVLGGVSIPLPPNAPTGAKLLLGSDGAPLKGPDGVYLFGVG